MKNFPVLAVGLGGAEELVRAGVGLGLLGLLGVLLVLRPSGLQVVSSLLCTDVQKPTERAGNGDEKPRHAASILRRAAVGATYITATVLEREKIPIFSTADR